MDLEGGAFTRESGMEKTFPKAGELQGWGFRVKPQTPFKSLFLNTFLVEGHNPAFTFPWKTVIRDGGKPRVGCEALCAVNGLDYMFLPTPPSEKGCHWLQNIIKPFLM